MNIIVGGDVSLTGKFGIVEEAQCSKLFNELSKVLDSADYSIFNLESPLTKSEKAIEKIGPSLKGNPSWAKHLKKLGFDAANLANNHIFDFGMEGLKDTIQSCKEYGLETVGAGLTKADIQQPLRVRIEGVNISIVSCCEREFNISEDGTHGANTLENEFDIYRTILLEKSLSDLVIVIFHGGNEFYSLPRPGLRKLFKFYVDLGADAVIGHHPHVPGAIETYKNKPLVYSLGNLIFDKKNPPKDWNVGFLIKLTVGSEEIKFSRIGYSQSLEDNDFRLLEGEENEAFLKRMKDLDSVLSDDDSYGKKWNSYVKQEGKNILVRMLSPIQFRGLGLLARKTPIIKMFMMNNRSRLIKMNTLRCNSHRELLISAINKAHGKND